MSAVDRLLAEYMEEHRSGGEADPVAYLDRAAAEDRGELAALIDGYLARAPRREFDESALRDSQAEAMVDELQRSLAGCSGLWPAMLPRLRARAGLKRRELVERLALTLDVGERTEKVGRYYHEMEQGLLPADGVSDRVLEALARLVGSTPSTLRDAGRALAAAPERPGGGEAFARATPPDALAVPATPPAEGPAQEPWDEVDELFRRGRDSLARGV
jgi:hypothetical protein